MLTAARALGYVAALVAGAAAGLLGSFKYTYTDGWLPVGLLVALCLSLAVFVTAGLALRSRGAAAAAGAGWLVMVGLMSMYGPGRDLVVPASTLGLIWLLVGTVLAGLSLALAYASVSPAPRRNEPVEAPAEESSGRAPTGR